MCNEQDGLRSGFTLSQTTCLFPTASCSLRRGGGPAGWTSVVGTANAPARDAFTRTARGILSSNSIWAVSNEQLAGRHRNDPTATRRGQPAEGRAVVGRRPVDPATRRSATRSQRSTYHPRRAKRSAPRCATPVRVDERGRANNRQRAPSRAAGARILVIFKVNQRLTNY